MTWQAETIALLASGGMLTAVALSSLHPRVALGTASRTIFLLGGAVFLGIGIVAVLHQDLDLPPVILAFPLLPLAVIAVLGYQAVRDRGREEPLPIVASTSGELPVTVAPFGAGGTGAERLLAASPYATPTELVELAYARPDLRPAIASNPVTPASLLGWLLEQGEPEVLAAIAARPAHG